MEKSENVCVLMLHISLSSLASDSRRQDRKKNSKKLWDANVGLQNKVSVEKEREERKYLQKETAILINTFY